MYLNENILPKQFNGDYTRLYYIDLVSQSHWWRNILRNNECEIREIKDILYLKNVYRDHNIIM